MSPDPLLFRLGHVSHKGSGKDLLYHLAGYLEQADIRILYNTSRELRDHLPDSAVGEWENPLERLKYVTALARSMPDHYACDSCFQLHPVTPSHSLRLARSPPPYDEAPPPYSSRTSHLLKKAKQLLWHKAAKPNPATQVVGQAQAKAEQTEQTHEVTVLAVQRALQGDSSGLSAVRPPCKANLRLMKRPRPSTHPNSIISLFDSLIHDENDGRRTPLAGLTHQHVQMALKRWRMESEARPSSYPRRTQPPYTAVRHVRGYSRGDMDEIRYRFSPRIVTRGGRNYYVIKTEVDAPNYAPISLCPHQIINQVDQKAQFWRMYVRSSEYKDNLKYNTTNFSNARQTFNKSLGPSSPIFSYSLKDAAIRREPYTSGSIMFSGWRLYYMGNGRTGCGRPDVARRRTLPYRRFLGSGNLYASCKNCPTDYQMSCSQRIKYTVWQNLGSEGSALDPVWQSHIPGEFLQAQHGLDDAQTCSYMSAPELDLPWETNGYKSGPSVWAGRGTIYDMYRKHNVAT